MVERWLEANRRAQEEQRLGPHGRHVHRGRHLRLEHRPATRSSWRSGRDEIRTIALGTEMAGLEGWIYPYQRVLVDDRQGEVIGLWKQVADGTKEDGTPYEVAGLGGSWFRYAGNWQWSWQRDFFDVGNATALFIEMIKAGKLSDGMRHRMEVAASGNLLPGHYPLGTAPADLWT